MKLVWLASLASAVAVVAACGGDSGLSVEDALRRMVLQPGDLPEGFVQGDESFSTNDDAAAGDPEAKSQLDEWGRILGYEVTYEPAGTPAEESPARGINVSSNLYRTEEGASDAFADAVKAAEETDWAVNYAGLGDFQREELDADGLADEIVWLRLSGFQTVSGERQELATDDLIFFREGRERGFLRVQTVSSENEDRVYFRSTVEEWLRALVDNVRDALPEVEEEG